MKIIEGLELDPGEFHTQVRGLRHLPRLFEQDEEPSAAVRAKQARQVISDRLKDAEGSGDFGIGGGDEVVYVNVQPEDTHEYGIQLNMIARELGYSIRAEPSGEGVRYVLTRR
jgi:hypothetical protein